MIVRAHVLLKLKALAVTSLAVTSLAVTSLAPHRSFSQDRGYQLLCIIVIYLGSAPGGRLRDDPRPDNDVCMMFISTIDQPIERVIVHALDCQFSRPIGLGRCSYQ